MSISLKVLEKAIEKKDFTFLASNLAKKLREYGWDDEDIRCLARLLDDKGRQD